MKQKRKKGSLVTLNKEDFWKPDISIQDSWKFSAFTGGGCPVLFLHHGVKIWGSGPFRILRDRLHFAWRVIRYGSGLSGDDIALSPADCKKLSAKLTEFGRWMDKNRWKGKKPKPQPVCEECGSKKIK